LPTGLSSTVAIGTLAALTINDGFLNVKLIGSELRTDGPLCYCNARWWSL